MSANRVGLIEPRMVKRARSSVELHRVNGPADGFGDRKAFAAVVSVNLPPAETLSIQPVGTPETEAIAEP